MRAKGIVFAIGDGGSPEVFNPIINVTVFKIDGTKWATEKTTSHDSETPIETIQTTIRTDGTLTLTLTSFESANAYHALLKTLSLTGAANNFRVSYPSGASLGSFDFSGYVTGFATDTPVDGVMHGLVTIAVSGAVENDPAHITSLRFTTFAGIYLTGNIMRLAAVFDEVVNVTGAPRIPITLGTSTVFANYLAGTGTNVLTFTHAVAIGDVATLGQVTVTSPLDLNAGTILDTAGQPSALNFTSPDTSTFTVN